MIKLISETHQFVFILFLTLYGIDTISLGGIVAFVMELYQKKMISKTDLDGIEAQWGSGDALVRLTEMIAKGEGIGDNGTPPIGTKLDTHSCISPVVSSTSPEWCSMSKRYRRGWQ